MLGSAKVPCAVRNLSEIGACLVVQTTFGIPETFKCVMPDRTPQTCHQHDAYRIEAWLSRADQDGSLGTFLKPHLTPPERALCVAPIPGLTVHSDGALCM